MWQGLCVFDQPAVLGSMPSCCGLTVTLRCQRVVIHNVEDCLSQMTFCCALTGSRAPHAASAAEGEACAIVTMMTALLLFTYRRPMPHMLHQQLRGMPVLVGAALRRGGQASRGL